VDLAVASVAGRLPAFRAAGCACAGVIRRIIRTDSQNLLRQVSVELLSPFNYIEDDNDFARKTAQSSPTKSPAWTRE